MQALLDPTAPLPAGWPPGALGAFLVFLFPVGGGIPLGVILAKDAGVPAIATAGLYLLTDIIGAVTNEPFLIFLRWLSRRFPPLARVGEAFQRASSRVGLSDEGARGPLGLILVSFAVSPLAGRAAAASAGHGFVPGWALAITGDMLYFALLMVSTLWLTQLLGNDRLTVGIMLGVTWLLPLVLRWARGKRQAAPAPSVAPIEPAARSRPRRQRRRQQARTAH